jgi:di/tricarboxylate transporter
LIGLTLHDARIGTRFHARVIGIERVGGVFVPSPGPDAEVHADDALVMVAHQPEADALTREFGLERRTLGEAELTKIQQFVGLAVVLVHPDSGLIGADLRSARFRTAHGLHVVGLRRRDTIVTDFVDEPLEPGDALLLIGAWDDIAQLQTESHDFVVLTLPAEYAEIAPARDRAPWALAILAGMVLLSAFEIVPVVAAVLIAGLAAVFTRCLTMEDGYRAVSWSSLVLIAGMLPIADALQKTGGTDLVVELLIEELGYSTPYFVMSVIFFVTAGLGLVLSNTATAVLMAPIAIQAAQAIGVSPHPLAMTVAIAVSAAFATPVSTPVVTLVVSPGGYRFLDFVKVGTPLMLLAWLTTLLVTPLFFPF